MDWRVHGSSLPSSKMILPLVITILLTGIIGTQYAFAETKTFLGTTSPSAWETESNWNPPGIPKKNDDVVINSVTVDISSDVLIGPAGSVTTSSNGDIRVVKQGSLTIQGTYTMDGLKDDLFAREGTIINDATGSINLGLAQIIVQGTGTGGIFINHGTIIGSLTGTPPVGEGPSNNDFNIVIQSGGLFQNSGTCTSTTKVLTGGTIEGISCVSGNNSFNEIQETEFVIEEIDNFIAPYFGTPVEQKLSNAMDKVDTALEELEKSPPDNEAAVGNMESAVGEIEAAVNEAMNLAEATQLMDDLTEIARQMADAAINLAMSEPNSLEEKISLAQEYLAEGDVLKASGDFKDAVNKYKGALSEAKNALN